MVKVATAARTQLSSVMLVRLARLCSGHHLLRMVSDCNTGWVVFVCHNFLAASRDAKVPAIRCRRQTAGGAGLRMCLFGKAPRELNHPHTFTHQV